MLLPALNQGPEVIKVFPYSTQLSMKFQMLISTKYQEIQHFLGSDKPKMLFFLLISVTMLTFKHLLAGKISFSTELSMKKVL